MRSLLLGSVLLLSAVSCTTVPSAHVARARVDRQGPEGGRVAVVVRLENKTSVPMPIVGVSYWLAVDGVKPMTPFEIEDQPFMTVPASTPTQSGVREPGVQEVVLPAGVASLAALAGKPCVIEGVLTFEPDTDWRRLKTEAGVPLPTRSFRGVIVLDSPPSAEKPLVEKEGAPSGAK